MNRLLKSIFSIISILSILLLVIIFSPVRAKAVENADIALQLQTDMQNVQPEVDNDQQVNGMNIQSTAHQIEYTGDRELYAKTNNNNVRSYPDVDAEILISAPPGNDLKIWSVWASSSGETWYEVDYLGNTGYVWGGAVKVYENTIDSGDANDTVEDTQDDTDVLQDGTTDVIGPDFIPTSDLVYSLPVVTPISVTPYNEGNAPDDEYTAERDGGFKRVIRRPFDMYSVVLLLFVVILSLGIVFFVKRMQYELKRYKSLLNKKVSVKRPKKQPNEKRKTDDDENNYEFIDILDDF